MISVIVPTVVGREDHYARCVAAYERTAGDRIEIITIRDRPTCGLAWNEGAAQAKGDAVPAMPGLERLASRGLMLPSRAEMPSYSKPNFVAAIALAPCRVQVARPALGW